MRKQPQSPFFSSLAHAFTELENIGFTHRTLVGKRHCRGMQLQSVRSNTGNKECTTSATPAPCDSKQTPCTSFPLSCNICTGTLCVLPSQSLRRVHSVFVAGGIALLRYLARITLKSSDQKRTECEEKPSSSLPGVRARVRLHHQILSRHQCRHPSRGILEQLSIRVCSKIAAKTCS